MWPRGATMFHRRCPTCWMWKPIEHFHPPNGHHIRNVPCDECERKRLQSRSPNKEDHSV